ncbi:carbohydrate kinase family protein [Nocardioides sp. TF02-7]|uniref:carbohydrate kinase family protein n=1 Tax=Nocardioides sp. TF02-7 TaxID=2917724 RepID=UPI001F06B472|nr:carbohydrate kinase family protein [Nocardioides sp. TF02-7]UMG91431.1 carbohydrate kinase family protein [Nocardioides sp. TF02-7]
MSGVVVVGGVNVDLKARSTDPLVDGTSNPGHTVLSPGGVGRNVAENLARLGTPVALWSAVGDDPLGDEVLATTAAAGVDVAGVRRAPAHPTGSYTAVLDSSGELAVAVSDMAAVEAIRPDDLPATMLDGASLVVLDGNLLPDTVARVLELAGDAAVPAVVEPVSVAKAARLAPLLGPAVHAVTPNLDELAALTGHVAPGTTDQAVARLHEAGVALVWVRLGREGSLLSGPDGTTRLRPVPVEVVDVTGAGDAMLAAFAHALLGGAAPAEAAAYGHAAAALTIASEHTVRPDLTDDLVRSLL